MLERSASFLVADVLVPPHHGSKTSSTQQFIAQVSPQVAVITNGYRNRFGHPKAEILARYREAGSTIFRSDLDGAVLFDLLPGRGVMVKTWRHSARRYWHEPGVGVAENSHAG